MAYKEVKMDKGVANAVFGGLNDNFAPKGTKPTKKQPTRTADKSNSKKKKIH